MYNILMVIKWCNWAGQEKYNQTQQVFHRISDQALYGQVEK